MVFSSVSDPDSLMPDPDSLMPDEYQSDSDSGSGTRVLTFDDQKFKKIYS
jgi:hypothetical protein